MWTAWVKYTDAEVDAWFKSADELLRYIEQQYDEALMEETRIKRNPKFKDNRVHVLLYFIQPTGHA